MNRRSTKVITDFFSTLLEDNKPVRELEQKPLAELLAAVSETAPEIVISDELEQALPQPPPVNPAKTDVTEPDVTVLPAIEETPDVTKSLVVSPLQTNTLESEMAESFPVLYFKVAGVTMAVPLIKLRAIYPLREVTKLIGKPSWFHGVQVERGENISVIDTVKYIFDEKGQSELEQSLNYKYIIVLGDSNWGLLCEELIDSCTLSYEDIKWRTGVKKSPWLAGTVKQRMCGLLAVDALVQLLSDNNG